jgi:hypothetical protein
MKWAAICFVMLWAARGEAKEASPFARMGWLQGSWTGVTDGMKLEEHWTSADGDGLVGMHKDVKDGKMVSFEFFRIEPQADGVYYMTSPHGQPATPFKLVRQEERRLVFENPEHDFPQRILYWSDRPGTLSARIEGTLHGKEESEEWHWKRAK